MEQKRWPQLENCEWENILSSNKTTIPSMRQRKKRVSVQKQIELLEWPFQSPDLNPIEHLWAILDQKAGALCLKKKEELKILLQEAWTQIDSDRTKKLVESMKNELAEVIKVNGGPTRYLKSHNNLFGENFDLKKFV